MRSRWRSPLAVLAAVVGSASVAGPVAAGFAASTTASQGVSTAVLAAPAAVTAAVECVPGGRGGGSLSVLVAWQPVADADGYEVWRTDRGAAPVLVATVGAEVQSLVDPAVSPRATYAYRVAGRLRAWSSSLSPEAAVTTPSASCR